MRKAIRSGFVALLVGGLCVGVAWAGAGLIPVSTKKGAGQKTPVGTAQGGARLPVGEEGQAEGNPVLQPGQFYAGSAKVSMEPRPQDYDGTWEQDRGKCSTLTDPNGVPEGATHVVDTRVRWNENPNCLYMGGYGLGPINPITSWQDPYGLWVRAVALSDGTDTVVLALLDGAYYEGKYNSMCNGAPFGAEQDCGFFDLRTRLAEELGDLGVAESGVFLSFTHSHTAPDFIGAWGGVPKWYMQQTEESIVAAATAAVNSMRPAALEIGETYARQFSAERRDHYRSAEDQNLAWFRAVEPVTTESTDPKCTQGPGQEKKPECQPTTSYRAIATVGAFAAHPVTADETLGVADADFPAVFGKAAEDRWGGVGILFQTGLGNISPRHGDHPEGNLEKEKIGYGLASLIPDIGGGRQPANTDVRSAQHWWEQPVTNSVLATGGLSGIFDRSFNERPAAINVGDSEFPNKRCTSASPVSVRTVVSAAKIGDLWITAGPGELFSNLTNTIKEDNPTGVTLPLGITNDGLGYIVQSFETDHLGRQGVGFVGGPFSEYEDAYSVDHCIGDATLEYTLNLLGSL
jgi:hypothetical protein